MAKRYKQTGAISALDMIHRIDHALDAPSIMVGFADKSWTMLDVDANAPVRAIERRYGKRLDFITQAVGSDFPKDIGREGYTFMPARNIVDGRSHKSFVDTYDSRQIIDPDDGGAVRGDYDRPKDVELAVLGTLAWLGAEISASKVREIFLDSLFKPDEIVDGKQPEECIKVQGITMSFGFHPGRLMSHRAEVVEMLDFLPVEFRATGGGGWSFLNAVRTASGRQWGEQMNAQELMCLGIGLGLVEELMPGMRVIMPGGVPYYKILDGKF